MPVRFPKKILNYLIYLPICGDNLNEIRRTYAQRNGNNRMYGSAQREQVSIALYDHA